MVDTHIMKKKSAPKQQLLILSFVVLSAFCSLYTIPFFTPSVSAAGTVTYADGPENEALCTAECNITCVHVGAGAGGGYSWICNDPKKKSAQTDPFGDNKNYFDSSFFNGSTYEISL